MFQRRLLFQGVRCSESSLARISNPGVWIRHASRRFSRVSSRQQEDSTSHSPDVSPANESEFKSRDKVGSKPRQLDSEGTINLTRKSLPNGNYKAIITIINPKKLNILNTATLIKLKNTFKYLEENNEDGKLRAVVITGQADPSRTASFCAGADITEMEAINTHKEALQFINGIHKACEALKTMSTITFARIDGLCFGAGLELAACCDFRYGTERSTFSMREVAVGIPSVLHARLLPEIMGWQAAKRLVLFGNIIDADEAHHSHLLDMKSSTIEEMDAKLDEDILLLSSYGRKTMRVQKDLIHMWERETMERGITAGFNAFAKMFHDGGKEPKHGMGAWLQRKADKKVE